MTNSASGSHALQTQIQKVAASANNTKPKLKVNLAMIFFLFPPSFLLKHSFKLSALLYQNFLLHYFTATFGTEASGKVAATG